eukprot:3891899-Prymnesium_polylepis.1
MACPPSNTLLWHARPNMASAPQYGIATSERTCTRCAPPSYGTYPSLCSALIWQASRELQE